MLSVSYCYSGSEHGVGGQNIINFDVLIQFQIRPRICKNQNHNENGGTIKVTTNLLAMKHGIGMADMLMLLSYCICSNKIETSTSSLLANSIVTPTIYTTPSTHT